MHNAPWSREELLLTLNLYCKLTIGKMRASNPSVIALASHLNRTPASIALKLGNLASLDPAMAAKGISGTTHASKLDKVVWDEFFANIDELAYESESQWRLFTNGNSLEFTNKLIEGKEKQVLVKTRINQSFFRQMMISSYNGKCAITGLNIQSLLVAGHISSWATDKENRMNPQNGILLSAPT